MKYIYIWIKTAELQPHDAEPIAVHGMMWCLGLTRDREIKAVPWGGGLITKWRHSRCRRPSLLMAVTHTSQPIIRSSPHLQGRARGSSASRPSAEVRLLPDPPVNRFTGHTKDPSGGSDCCARAGKGGRVGSCCSQEKIGKTLVFDWWLIIGWRIRNTNYGQPSPSLRWAWSTQLYMPKINVRLQVCKTLLDW